MKAHRRQVITRGLRIAALALLAMLPWDAPAAHAQLEALNGTYDLVWWRQCVSEDLGSGSPSFGPLLVQGKLTFDGVGGGSFTGETIIPIGQGTELNPVSDGSGSNYAFAQADMSGCVATYAVSANGSFLGTLNSCTLTFTSGAQVDPPGPTASLNGLTIKGKLAFDGTVLVLRSTKATSPTTKVETVQFGTDPAIKRICPGHGMATSNR